MIQSPVSTVSSGFASHALQLLQRVQHGTSPVELIYTAHERWPFRPGQTIHTRPTLRISVLDSSFNPPTLAHLALANSLSPLSFHPATRQPASSLQVSAEPYDARMLLLSVRNADKLLKPGDASFVQRLEMMYLLSHDIRSTDPDNAESGGESSQISGNVAVAIIDEPTFVRKSTVLPRFLRTKLAAIVESTDSRKDISNKRDTSCLSPFLMLTFLLGFDTFVRLFSPKYYPSKQAMMQMLQAFLSREDCRIVCAHRGNASTDAVFGVADQFITSKRIAFIDIGAEEQTYSSSEVRAKIATGDWTWRRLVTNAIADYIIKQGIYSSPEREQ